MGQLLALDDWVTLSLYDWGTANPGLQKFFLYIAVVAVYALPVVLVWLFWRNQKSDRRVAIKVFLGAILVWRVFSQALGSILYGNYGFRDRPFSARGLQEFFFEQPQKAFPSDHAAVLTVVAALFLLYRYPKLGWIFGAGLVLTGFGRIVVGFHYLGDVLGGIGLGLIVVAILALLDRFIERLFDKWNLAKANDEN